MSVTTFVACLDRVDRSGEYRLDSPLGSPADDAILACLEDACQSLQGSVEPGNWWSADEGKNPLQRRHEGLLWAFAVRMASLAVREDSLLRLRHAIRAMAVASHVPDWDPHDYFTPFQPIIDAACRITADTRPAFRDGQAIARADMQKLIAGLAPGPFRRIQMRLFGVPSGWRLQELPDGLRYEQRLPEGAEEVLAEFVSRFPPNGT